MSNENCRVRPLSYDIAIKFVTPLVSLLVGAIGTWKVVVELLRGRHGHLREEYKFARDFLADLAATPQMHPFLKQKGFQAIAGDTRLTAAEIEYLLTLQNSSQALKDYVLGKQYLQHFATATGSQLIFKPYFERSFSRLWRKVGYLLLYFGCYCGGFAPLMLPVFKALPPEQAIVAFTFTAILFFPAGFFALKAGVRIARAEVLVKSQHKHAQAIVVAARQF